MRLVKTKYMESLLSRVCIAWLESIESPIGFYRTQSGGIPIRGRFAPNPFVGISDLLIGLPGGRLVFVELKTKPGSMSESQHRFAEHWFSLGFPYFVVRSPEAFEALIRQEYLKATGTELVLRSEK